MVASEDGLAKVRTLLGRMSPDGLVVTLPAFAGIASPAQVSVVDPAAAPGARPEGIALPRPPHRGDDPARGAIGGGIARRAQVPSPPRTWRRSRRDWRSPDGGCALFGGLTTAHSPVATWEKVVAEILGSPDGLRRSAGRSLPARTGPVLRVAGSG